ncbi:hypothetical protein FA13DRAFT_1730005 [Coprinellus micaceus]|uniref:Uncharacterized protein n=1 Tax=Coprinellus micaceus TaxID=71717 RepID=A0A4Y7TID6_COPMI|nr:hypothetical protein FA13DRAFT_1730005 [Coprinellus micaceus]
MTGAILAEDDPDATCVATDTELHEAVKAIAASKRTSSTLAPGRKHISRTSASTLAVKTASQAPPPPGGQLVTSPTHGSSWKTDARDREVLEVAQPPVGSCCYDEENGFGCRWKEQVRRVQADASNEKAINDQIVHNLRRHLARAEEEAKGVQYALCDMEARLGLKDMYIRTLLAAKDKAGRQAAVIRDRNAELREKLEERELEIVDQRAEIISWRKVAKEWEGRHASLKLEAESERGEQKGRMEKLEHEAAAKGNRILTLEQEKSRLEDLSSSVKLTVSEQAKTISELKRGVERNTADLALKDLRIEALSRVRKKENDSAYQSMQEIIAEKEQRITDLNGRLTECHRRLKRLSSGDPTSAAQERFEATVGNVDGRIRRTKAPSPIPTTPAYERLKELSCSFARANRGQDHAATVIFPMQRASQWQ